MLLLQTLRYLINIAQLPIEILELVQHVGSPETFFLQVLNELPVEHGEIPTEVTLHKKVLVVRLDTRGGSHDIRDGRGRRNGKNIGISNSMLHDFLANRFPVHFTSPRNGHSITSLVFE